MSKIYIPLNIQRFGGSWGFSDAYAYDYSVSNNTNWIYCKIYITSNSTTYNQTGNAYCTLTANASNGGGSYSQTQYYTIAKGSTIYLEYWMGPFSHNADGTLPSISLGGHIYVTSNTQFDITGNIYPNSIARAPSYNSINASSITETSVRLTSSVDGKGLSITDGGWDVSTNGGSSWTYYSGGVTDKTITGLSPNTTYWYRGYAVTAGGGTNSGWSSFTTYPYPSITNSSNFNVGNANTVSINNPLGRNVSIHVQPNGSSTWYGGDTTTGTSISGYNNSGWRDIWYQYCTNKTSNTYRVKLTYGSHTHTTGYSYKYTIVESYNSGECKPTFSDFDCQDTNSSIVALTGDSSKIVLGYSNVQVSIPTNKKATANKYASMSSYKMAINGNNPVTSSYNSSSTVNMTINTVKNNSITVTAYDSRGFSRSVTKSLTNVGYTAPVIDTLNAKLIRSNNGIGEQVTLQFSGTYWNQNFGVTTNTIKTLTYQYKTTSEGNYSVETNIIGDMTTSGSTFSYNHLIAGPTQSQGYDISTAYNIKINWSDELSSGSFVLTLGSGTPKIAIAENGVAIGSKYDDTKGGSFQLNGERFQSFATNTIAGGVKLRVSNGVLYIRTDGNDA